MKNVSTILFTVLVAFAATSFALSNTWGNVETNDKVLLSERVFKYYTYRPPYGAYRHVEFPKHGKTNEAKITAIQTIDFAGNITASRASIVAGGPGFTFTILAFQSEEENDLDYQLLIYGK